MTGEATDQAPNGPEREDDDRRFDVMLLALAKTASMSAETKVPITVSTPAGVMTGVLINRDEWLRQFAESPENKDGKRFLGELVSELDQTADERGIESDWKNFLHLADAHYVVGGRVLPDGPGMLWRCWLDEVIGWSLGSLA